MEKENENFADRLIEEIEKTKSPICVGLDPDFEKFPEFLKKEKKEKAIFEFTKRIIDATFDLVPAFKIQTAFYEKEKSIGIKILEKTISYLKEKGKIVILDIKKGDIGNIAKIQAKTYLSKEGFDGDAVTLNPYLGTDSILPFLEIAKKEKKGIFVLTKTSNPSSREIQDQKTIKKERIYERVAKLIKKWGKNTEGRTGFQIVGAVVSATFPKVAKKLRELLPKTIFLVPGYGKQGGKAKDVIFHFKKGLRGAIINNSRGIIFAFREPNFKIKFKEKEFERASREAVLEMKKELWKIQKLRN